MVEALIDSGADATSIPERVAERLELYTLPYVCGPVRMIPQGEEMASTTLEERVAELERLVDELMHKSGRPAAEKNWRRTIGMFDGDEIMKEIIEEGRRIREEDREQTDS